ncbi:hypothetical protein D3C87_1076660 [compost metagenome]
MSWINDRQESKFNRLRNDSHYGPIVDAVRKVQKDGVAPQTVIEEAVRATRDQYVASGRPIDTEDIRRDAFLAATAGSIEAPYELSGLPEGTDKTKHYFWSGAFSAKIDQALDALKVVPRSVRETVAVGATVFVGWLKEVADLFTTGYSKDDLKADRMGAKSPFEVKVA